MSDNISPDLPDRNAGSVEKLADKIASDQSTGTFVCPCRRDAGTEGAASPPASSRVRSLDTVVRDRLRSLHDDLAATHARSAAAKPTRLHRWEAIGTDLAALMTIAIGGVYSIKGFSRHPRDDIRLPPAFGKAWPGPQFGSVVRSG